MAGLRLRWRRAGSELTSTAPAPAALASLESRRSLLIWSAALLIVGLGLAARLYNVNWDANGHLHPDERHLTTVANDVSLPSGFGEYFDSKDSPLNPYNRPGGGSFVYGTLPLFLTKGIAALVHQDNYDQLVLIGRRLSALFSGLTILLVFLTGRRLYGPVAGLLGAVLFAAAPLAVQHAHFFVVDPFLTFFASAVLYFGVRAAQDGRTSDFALGGLALGLGMACKVTAVLFAPVLAVAALLYVWQTLRDRSEAASVSIENAGSIAGRPIAALLLAALIAFIAFRIAQPYAFQAPKLSDLAPWTIKLDKRWVDDQKQQSKLLGGDAAFPPSVQWIGRQSYIYPLREMVVWGMGPAFGIAGWLGVVYAGYRLLRNRDLRHVLPLVFVVLYFGFMGRQFSLYLRYFLPLYPALAVLAGFLLIEVMRLAGRGAGRLARPEIATVARVAVAAVLAVAVFFGLAYLSIYTRQVTRVEANAWFAQNVAPGKTIAVEHWDDRVPGHAEGRYTFIDLPMYDADTTDKVNKLIQSLDRADYIVLSSNRLIASIPRAPAVYPVSSAYYRLLLDGQLGFGLAKSFTSHPGLLGIDLNDDNTEESWSSYDHPRVLVFEKTADYSHDRALALLNPNRAADAVSITPGDAGTNALRLRPADLETQRNGGTWDDVFSSEGLAADHPVVLWLLALELAAFAVTPAALMLFRRLPDRGYLLAKPLGLVFLAYPVWLIVSLKLVHFTQETILAWLVLLLLAGAALAVRFSDELAEAFKRHWRIFLLGEALFLLAFFVFYEFRLLNPDLWHPWRGGEKPMDLAYLTAVTRSTTLPPYDPWFAGGYINYYYMGQFFTATVSKLTAIPPEFAFNLAVPMYFALTVAGVFAITYNLTAAARSLLRRQPNLRPIPAWSPAAAAILGVVLVTVIGNLQALDQMADRLSAVSSWKVHSGIPLVGALVNSLGGLWQVVVHGADLKPQFDYWRPSRMMPPTVSITEFPYFSFLFADLHAHMMAIPFDVLAIGGAAGLALNRPGDRQTWREWLLVALLGLVVGSLRWLNSWDYPPFLLLGIAAVLIGERRIEGGLRRAGVRAVLKSLLLVAVSFAAFYPLLADYTSPVNGVHRSPETTPLHQYLAHFGILLAPVGAWLLWQLWRSLRSTPVGFLVRAARRRGAAESWALYERMPPDGQLWISAALIGALTVLALAAVLAGRGQTTIAAMVVVLPLVAFMAGREFLRPRPDSGVRLFVLAMLGLAFGLSLSVDLVTINGDIQRMNTVFKFYLHIWLLLGITAAFAVWYLAFVVWQPRLRAVEWRLPKLAPRYAGGAALAALLAAGLIYPIAATPVRLNERFVDLPPTLDGTAYMRQAVYQEEKGPINLDSDYEGIQWLRHNVQGTPVIIEASIRNLYRWGSRFSIYTGLPDVMGWDWHQKQQRGPFGGPAIDRRRDQVQRFYDDPDPKQAIATLSEFDVKYVIVGEVERQYSKPEGLAKFESGLDGVLEVAFKNSDLTIYRVKLDPLQLVLKSLH